MKKVLITAMVICSFSFGINQIEAKPANPVNSDLDAPIEVHPARIDNNKAFNQFTDSSKTPPKNIEKSVTKKQAEIKATDKKTAKPRHKRIRKIAPIKVVINYSNINKMIENNDFDGAQKVINIALKQNPKDLKAQALQTVSFAKQNKLDLAQAQVDKLIKLDAKNADLHYAQGIIYFKRPDSSNMVYINNTQKYLDDSLKEFNTAILLDKKSAKYYNAAGVASLKLGNTTSAKDFFNKAIALDKTYSTAIDNLGTIDFSNGKYDDANKKFLQALSYNKQSATTLYHLAQVATVKQNFPSAINYLTKSIALNPNSTAAYNLLGETYQNQGNEAAAINAFKKAISLKPEFTQPYFNLAEIYEKRGDSEFAVEQLRTVVSIDSGAYAAKLRIADISLATGKYNQAIETYASLVGVSDYNSLALKGLADSYYEKARISSVKSIFGSNKDIFNAIEYINKAIDANNATGGSTSSTLELQLAKLKLAKITNQPKLSDAALSEIINSKDNSLNGLIIKGEAYLALNNNIEAKKMFEMAEASTTKTQDNFQDDISLAEIFIYHKQYDNAKNIIEKVLKFDSKNAQAISDLDHIKKNEDAAKKYLQTAEFYLKAKNTNLAIDALCSSLSFDPNNANAHLLLAELYEKQKDYKSAILNYKIYLSLAPNASNKNKVAKQLQKLERKQL